MMETGEKETALAFSSCYLTNALQEYTLKPTFIMTNSTEKTYL